MLDIYFDGKKSTGGATVSFIERIILGKNTASRWPDFQCIVTDINQNITSMDLHNLQW